MKRLLVRKILVGLQKEEASRAHNVANEIYFKGGFRFVESWNILLPINSGTITVKEQRDEIHVRYKLQFTQTLVLTAVFVPIFFGTVSLTQLFAIHS